jgi:hypothetical protein
LLLTASSLSIATVNARAAHACRAKSPLISKVQEFVDRMLQAACHRVHPKAEIGCKFSQYFSPLIMVAHYHSPARYTQELCIVILHCQLQL